MWELPNKGSPPKIDPTLQGRKDEAKVCDELHTRVRSLLV